MAKRKEEPTRPYHDVKHEYEASRKAFDDASNILYSTAESVANHMADTDPLKRFLVDAVAKYRAAAYGG